MQIFWSPGVSLEEMEKKVILNAYELYKKNAYLTSQALKIEHNFLQKKLVKYEKERIAEEEKIEIRKKLEQDYIDRARGVKPITV